MTKHRNKRFRLVWLELFSALAAVIAILVLYLGLGLHGQQLLENQTEKLARSLTSLAAFNAANYIETNQPKQLEQLVNALVEENFVFDATIYDHQGVVLAQSSNALPLRALLPMSGNPVVPTQGIGRRPYIATIYNRQGKALGYLRITLEESSLLLSAVRYVHSAQLSLKVMLLLALWIGFIGARLLSAKRRKLIKRARRRRAILASRRLNQ